MLSSFSHHYAVFLQIFYYIFGAIVGVFKGLLQLNLGSITSFQEIVLTFHKTPWYWWNRCMSSRGKSNIAAQVKRALSPNLSEKSSGAFDTMVDVVRRREAALNAALVSEQVVDATSMLTTRFARSESAGRRLHLQDSALPQWLAFADAWNGIIDELRSIDLISNEEAQNLRFIHIALDDTTEVVAGMRPIMLPVFFYGGQITRALESPGNDPTQGAVLSELRALMVYILAQTGIVSPDQADALATFKPLRKTHSLEHRSKRVAGVQKTIKFLSVMKSIMGPCRDQGAALNRTNSIAELSEVLSDLIDLVEFEAMAVHKHYPKQARGEQERDPGRIQNKKAMDVIACVRDLRQERLSEDGWRFFWGENGGLDMILDEAEETSAKNNIKSVVSQLYKMLTTSAKGAQPRGEEAQRILSFFVGSLKNPTLETPPAVDDMLSWTVLTPHYEEDVLYALNSKQVANHFGLPISTTKGMSDLMSENEDGVTVMAWLRSNYPQEWNNLLERLAPALAKANVSPHLVNESDFDEGGPLASERMQLLYWASYRGQLLARTVRGEFWREMLLNEKPLLVYSKQNPLEGLHVIIPCNDLERWSPVP